MLQNDLNYFEIYLYIRYFCEKENVCRIDIIILTFSIGAIFEITIHEE